MKTFDIYDGEVEIPEEFDVHESDHGVWIEHSQAPGYGVKIMNGFSDPLIILPVEKTDEEVERLLSYPYTPMETDEIRRDIEKGIGVIRSRVAHEKGVVV